MEIWTRNTLVVMLGFEVYVSGTRASSSLDSQIPNVLFVKFEFEARVCNLLFIEINIFRETIKSSAKGVKAC